MTSHAIDTASDRQDLYVRNQRSMPYISFSAEINRGTAEGLIALLADLANQKVSAVYLMLATTGGSVAQGLNLYHMMRAFPFDLITHNVGSVDSIGTVVFLAGQKRFACRHSTFTFHGAGFDVAAGLHFDEGALRREFEAVRIKNRTAGRIIAERSTLANKTIARLFRDRQIKDARYALDWGIVHEIRDISIPTGSDLIAFKR